MRSNSLFLTVASLACLVLAQTASSAAQLPSFQGPILNVTAMLYPAPGRCQTPALARNYTLHSNYCLSVPSPNGTYGLLLTQCNSSFPGTAKVSVFSSPVCTGNSSQIWSVPLNGACLNTGTFGVRFPFGCAQGPPPANVSASRTPTPSHSPTASVSPVNASGAITAMVFPLSRSCASDPSLTRNYTMKQGACTAVSTQSGLIGLVYNSCNTTAGWNAGLSFFTSPTCTGGSSAQWTVPANGHCFDSGFLGLRLPFGCAGSPTASPRPSASSSPAPGMPIAITTSRNCTGSGGARTNVTARPGACNAIPLLGVGLKYTACNASARTASLSFFPSMSCVGTEWTWTVQWGTCFDTGFAGISLPAGCSSWAGPGLQPHRRRRSRVPMMIGAPPAALPGRSMTSPSSAPPASSSPYASHQQLLRRVSGLPSPAPSSSAVVAAAAAPRAEAQ